MLTHSPVEDFFVGEESESRPESEFHGSDLNLSQDFHRI
jgi:hypothetical protein